MKTLSRIGCIVLAVVVVLGIGLGVTRTVNRSRFPDPPNAPTDLADPESYPSGTDVVPGVTVTRIDTEHVKGFHFAPQERVSTGTIFTWGGSDGGPDYWRAAELASQGHEVYALFFFGPNAKYSDLQMIPLEFFGHALDYAREHTNDVEPVTVIGTSRGAELALLLPEYYPEITNVVAFAPTIYRWQGLNEWRNVSAWSWQGQPVEPFISFRNADPQAQQQISTAFLLGTPARFGPSHETALASTENPELALIKLDSVPGNVLAFAGEDDQMWPAARWARELKQLRPTCTEVHIYPEAGHLFEIAGPHVAGIAMGGTAEANSAAKEHSDEVLAQRLAQWHQR